MRAQLRVPNVLRLDPRAPMSHLTALVGMEVHIPLVFDTQLNRRGDCGADVLRLAQVLCIAASRPDTPLGSPHVIAHLREAMFSALLTGQSSTVSHVERHIGIEIAIDTTLLCQSSTEQTLRFGTVIDR